VQLIAKFFAALETKDLTIEQAARSFLSAGPACTDGMFSLRDRLVFMNGLKTSGSGDREALS
jgi:hypothetical protein